MQEKNQQAVVDIAAKHLGQKGGEGYSSTYDPSLLVAIPRYLNREAYKLTGKEFVGLDVWNAYEVSAITTKGQPVSGMMKITIPSNSEYHVESKSLKLYLNSFNMTRFGNTARQCIQSVTHTVERDLSELLLTDVKAFFFTDSWNSAHKPFGSYDKLSSLINLDDINFTSFESDASQLKSSGKGGMLLVTSNLLRSNCRVTNQPDWGDIYIFMQGDDLPDLESLAKYIVSHRTVSHFHEEICEMVFAHLTEAFKPNRMLVACLYTRRGGIDINPIRATSDELINYCFKEPQCRLEKTLRQ